MTTRRTFHRPVALLVALGALSVHGVSGCEDSPDLGEETDRARTGELGLGLTLDNGLSIDTISYSISGNGVMLTGTIPVSGSGTTFTATITGIPVGTQYTLRLTTAAGDAGVGCAGSAVFNITGGATTQVNVALSCDELDTSGAVIINGALNICPSIRDITYLPAAQTVGQNIALGAAARDVDSRPGPLTYSWSATSGSFVGAQTATPAFTCSVPGPVSITLQVSDGVCSKSSTLTAQCTPATAGDAGTGQDGGLGDGGQLDSGTATVLDAGPDAGTSPVDSGMATDAAGADAGSLPLVRINEVESKDGTPGDWIELYNYGTSTADLSGWMLTDEKKTHSYTIPTGTSIAPGAFLVFDQAVLTYGLGESDATRLLTSGSGSGRVVDSFAWIAHAPTTFGRCPDGSGAFTTTATSTKGGANACGPLSEPRIVINELESKGDTTGDFVELFNADVISVDLSGWVVKDKKDTDVYSVPAGTTLAPGGYLVFEQTQLGFGFGPMDAARLFDATGTMVVDFYSWSAHAVHTYGRCPNGSGPLIDTAGPTKGAANNCAIATPTARVVINEVESKDGNPGDWVELFNAGNATADISGFVLKDKNDNDAYQIPPNTTLVAGGYYVLDQAQFIFNLQGVDAARLYLFQAGSQTLVDSYAWSTHATTTYGRCPNGTGSFATTLASTKGASNSCAP